MKRLIFILLIIPFFSFGQTEYLPEIAWSTNIENSTFVNTDTFTVQVTPLDLSEPGAFPLRMGNYLVDNRGLRYEIIDTTSYPTITVVDIFGEGFAPFNNKIGYVYQSAGDGDSPSLPTHTFEKLDSKALDYAYRIDNDILWKEANLYAQDSADLATEAWVLTQIPDSVQNSNLHVEAGRLEDLTSRAVSVTFADTFLTQPIGEEPQIYRVESFKGNYRRSKLLWGWADASQPTNTGFSLNIDSSEPLANVVLEYIYVEIIKDYLFPAGVWDTGLTWDFNTRWGKF